MVIATGLLLLLGLTAFQFARAGLSPVFPYFVWGMLCWFGTMLATGWVGKDGGRPVWKRQLLAGASGIALAGAYLGGMLILAREELLLAGMLWLGGVLLIWGAGPDGQVHLSRSAVVSGAVAMFSLPAIASEHRLPVILGGVIGVALWLACSRERLGGRWLWWMGHTLAITLIAASCVVAHALLDPRDGNPWYAAWVPTSGGDRTGSEQARRGTGDGPDEVTGHSASSVGFDQGKTFSESGRDGLYDLWIESFGAPLKSGDQQKMIGLKPQGVRIVETGDRENLQAGRKFEMKREKKPEPPATTRPDVTAKAKVWVSGPMPVYIPLAVMDRYDGESWSVMEPGKGGPVVRAMGRNEGRATGDKWMEMILRPDSPAFSGENTYEIKVGNLGGDVLPLPATVERFRMGRVDRSSFFSSTRAGLVRLASRTVPPGATVEVVCPRIDPARVVRVEPALPRNSDPAMLDWSRAESWIPDTARAWASGEPRGWAQILAVVEQLKSRAQEQTWQEYETASAAVLMLRSMGYAVRLVSGLYGDQDDMDGRTGLAALGPEQVRFWLEVRLADGTWITVDPAPGYPILSGGKPGTSWATTTWSGAARWALGAWVWVLGGVMLTGGVWWWRVPLMDGLLTTWCRVRGYRWEEALRLVETRARWAGLARSPGTPLGIWLGRFDSTLARQVNLGLYGESASNADYMAMRPLARRMSQTMTRKMMLQHTKEAV